MPMRLLTVYPVLSPYLWYGITKENLTNFCRKYGMLDEDIKVMIDIYCNRKSVEIIMHDNSLSKTKFHRLNKQIHETLVRNIIAEQTNFK